MALLGDASDYGTAQYGTSLYGDTVTVPHLAAPSTVLTPVNVLRGTVTALPLHLTDTAQIHNPTGVPGQRMVYASRLDAPATVQTPLARTQTNVSAPLLVTSTTVRTPTNVLRGPVTVSPPLLTAAPVVRVPGAWQTIAALAVSAPSTVRTPGNVLRGVVTAAAQHLVAAATVRTPGPVYIRMTRVFAPVDVTVTDPAHYVVMLKVTTASAVLSPTTVATRSVFPPLLTAATTVPTPSALATRAVAAAHFTDGVQVFSPVAAPGGVSVAAQKVTTTSSVLSPSTTVGGVSIAPNLLAAPVALHQPATAVGAVAVVPPLLAAPATVRSPVSAPGGVTVFANRVITSTTVLSPAAAPGGVTVAPLLLTRPGSVFAPTAVSASMPEHVSDGATVFTPQATRTVTVPLLAAPSAVQTPGALASYTVAAPLLTARPDNYLNLPGPTAVSAVSLVFAEASLDPTGDLDVAIDLAMDDWTPVGFAFLTGRWKPQGGSRQWGLMINQMSTGTPILIWSTLGTDQVTVFGTVPVPFADGRRGQLRATLDLDNGAGGYTATFYTRFNDHEPWVVLEQIVGTGVTSIKQGVGATLAIGGNENTTAAPWVQTWPGKVYKAEYRQGIDGALIANPRYDLWSASTHGGAMGQVTYYVDPAGKTWGVWNGTGVVDRQIHALSVLPGGVAIAANHLSAPSVVHTPAQVPGTVTTVALHLAAPASFYLPDMRPGTAYALTDRVATTTTVHSPHTTVGNVDVGMQKVTNVSSVHMPRGVPGTITAVTPALAVTAQVYNPLAKEGLWLVNLPVLNAPPTVRAPGVATGPVAISTAMLTAPAFVYAPTWRMHVAALRLATSTAFHLPSTSTQTNVAAQHLAVPADVMLPRQLASRSFVANRLVTSTALYTPAAAPGTAPLLQPDLLVTTTALHEPGVAVGGVNVVTAPLAAPSIVRSPSARPGNVNIAVPHLAAPDAVHEPATVPGEVRAEAGTFTDAPAVHTPDVEGYTFIAVPVVVDGSEVFSPAAEVGGVLVEIEVLAAPPAFHEPSARRVVAHTRAREVGTTTKAMAMKNGRAAGSTMKTARSTRGKQMHSSTKPTGKT